MRLGIDLGGTAIKSGLVDDAGQVLFYETLPTNASGGADAVLDALTDACRRQLARAAVAAVGIGMPGTVDEARGVLVRAANLPLADYPLTQALSRRLGIPAYLGNDANCALYGEIYAGAGRESDNFLLVTVGTGIGGGIRIGGKIHLGMEGRAGEFGHMIVAMDGRPCRCGRVGCWEQYSSATALIRQGREAVEGHPESLILKKVNGDASKIEARTIIDAAREGDPVACQVYDKYIYYLAIGIVAIINAFDPEVIVLGGGVSKAGDFLLEPLRKKVAEYVFYKDLPYAEIKIATLGNDAGIIGAAMLGK